MGVSPASTHGDQQCAQQSPRHPGPAPDAKPSKHRPARHWHTEPCESSEQPCCCFARPRGPTSRNEAAWRLLAHLAQTPFYQRLRVELQVGYAVFSGMRQLNGDKPACCWACNRPMSQDGSLFEHIRHFPRAIASLDHWMNDFHWATPPWPNSSRRGPALAQAAELLWQAHLAGHWRRITSRALQRSL
jgi:secreted Zn-dependent insulinase-like peptidase